MNRYNSKAERARRMVDFRRDMTASAATNMQNMNNIQNIQNIDKGPLPIVMNLEAKTIENENFRTTLWTGAHLQLTVMSIPVGGEIPMEVHENEDQFIYIERGDAEVTVGSDERSAELLGRVKSGYCILIPAAKHHMVKNVGDRELKLFSVYAPPVHMRGTVRR